MISCQLPYESRRMPVFAENMVAASQPLAVQAGLKMLQEGGNAVDAALASAIALTVVEPTSNGIGGDAFALVWDGGRLHGINGSGKSPAAWSPDYFSSFDSMPERGWDTVTVPGAVSTWAALWERFGSLDFERLFAPAIYYAENGYPVSPVIAERWRETGAELKRFPGFRDCFMPGGEAPRCGEMFASLDMAQTLDTIRRSRGESFYRGELAERIARCAVEQGGALTADDLADHEPQWVEPLSIRYRGCDIHQIPPNGQGLAVLQGLGMLAQFDVAALAVDSADSIHLQAEAMKLAYADIFAHLADPAAMRLDPRRLLDGDYLAERAKQIDLDRAGSPVTGIAAEPGTVYLSTADASGMMVSFIQSNYQGFGSGIVVPGTGISLHNRGFGFTLEAGHPNQVGGGKRPFHTIIPGFVTRGDEPLLSFGVMGAHMQAQGQVQMVTRILDYRQNPQAASDAPRWHVAPGGELALESGIERQVMDRLAGRGHRLDTSAPPHLFGGAQLILKTAAGYAGGSDHRKDGMAAGF